ncbi:MAG: hypothetical protein O9311_18925 [Cytophagales bacterium]|nr:hypothetical protein [Cytophagales bacterium]
MNRAIGLLVIIVISAWVPASGQQCQIVQANSYQTICAGSEASFYLDCQAAVSINWYVNYVFVSSGFNFSYTFPSSGMYTILASYQSSTGGGGSGGGIPIIDDPGGGGGSVTLSVQVASPPQSPQISINSGFTTFCDNGSVTFGVANAIGEQAYTWSSVPAGFSANTANATFSNISQTTEFVLSTSYAGCTSEARQTITVVKTIMQPTADPRTPYHKKFLSPSGQSYDIHFWQTSATGTARLSANQAYVGQTYEVTEPGNFFIRAYDYVSNCWAAATGPLQVQLNYQPPVAEVAQAQNPGYTEVFLTNADSEHLMRYADYYWVTDATQNPSIVRQYSDGSILVGSKIFNNGTYYLRGRDRGTGKWGQTQTVNIQLANFDNSLNWTLAQTFDGTKEPDGELRVISESKNYFDERGQALQSQTKTFHYVIQGNATTETPFVFASQSLKDKYDRTVGGTLSAPILQNDFLYNGAFALNDQGQPLSYSDFDKPQPLATDQKGTLGNYFSAQNAWGETKVPEAKRLFSRTDFYEDGTGEERKSAQAGDIHFIGSGREVLKGTFPVGNSDAAGEGNELTDYLTKRAVVFGGPALKKIEGVQTVVRDENERFAVSISDKSGKVLMTARKGAQPFPSSVSSDKMAYFYVLGAPNSTTQSVTITGTSDYVLENTITNTTIAKLTSPLPHTYNLQAGYYRAVPISGNVKISYTNYFSDIAYQFYNDAGRLVSSVSPNGYEQWKGGAAYNDIDKSTHVYNHQGWLLSMTETDAGETNYRYRRDGKIRFSQNAQQKENESLYPGKGRFSYTNYDKLGRPVESGEYVGTALTFASLTQLEFADQVTYPENEKRDWVRTYYDMPGPSAGVSNFAQNYVRGAVSWTENANNRTWYSYDELGRVTAMVQWPKQLPLKFLTQYEYDFLGNVLTTSTRAFNSNNTEQDAFYHHYEYDRNKRLTKASTSRDGVKKTVQAEYFYYLHGPLKRVVLASKLQGIDFVYNIHGWLTQINHPDDSNVTNDPGRDSPATNGIRKDVFGMILEYYERTMVPVSVTSMQDPSKFHRLPSLTEPEEAKTQVAMATDPISLYKESMRQSAAALQQMGTDIGGQ